MSEQAPERDLSLAPPDRLAKAISWFAAKRLHCKDCNAQFTLSEGEIRYFLRQKLHIPQRCAECRKAPATPEATPDSLKGKFFSEPDPTRIPMVPWRHT